MRSHIPIDPLHPKTKIIKRITVTPITSNASSSIPNRINQSTDIIQSQSVLIPKR